MEVAKRFLDHLVEKLESELKQNKKCPTLEISTQILVERKDILDQLLIFKGIFEIEQQQCLQNEKAWMEEKDELLKKLEINHTKISIAVQTSEPNIPNPISIGVQVGNGIEELSGMMNQERQWLEREKQFEAKEIVFLEKEAAWNKERFDLLNNLTEKENILQMYLNQPDQLREIALTQETPEKSSVVRTKHTNKAICDSKTKYPDSNISTTEREDEMGTGFESRNTETQDSENKNGGKLACKERKRKMKNTEAVKADGRKVYDKELDQLEVNVAKKDTVNLLEELCPPTVYTVGDLSQIKVAEKEKKTIWGRLWKFFRKQ